MEQKPFIYAQSLESLADKKISVSEDNQMYISLIDGQIHEGTPDIPFNATVVAPPYYITHGNMFELPQVSMEDNGTHISNLLTNYANIENLEVNHANIENLEVNHANIENFSCGSFSPNTISTQKVNFGDNFIEKQLNGNLGLKGNTHIELNAPSAINATSDWFNITVGTSKLSLSKLTTTTPKGIKVLASESLWIENSLGTMTFKSYEGFAFGSNIAFKNSGDIYLGNPSRTTKIIGRGGLDISDMRLRLSGFDSEILLDAGLEITAPTIRINEQSETIVLGSTIVIEPIQEYEGTYTNDTAFCVDGYQDVSIEGFQSMYITGEDVVFAEDTRVVVGTWDLREALEEIYSKISEPA